MNGNNYRTPDAQAQPKPQPQQQQQPLQQQQPMMLPQQQQQQVYPQQRSEPNANGPDALRNLIINYIPTNVDENELRRLLFQYGPIENVRILTDRETQQSRGFGFVKYYYSTSAAQAISNLNGYPLMNKRLKVAYAKSYEAESFLSKMRIPQMRSYPNMMPQRQGPPQLMNGSMNLAFGMTPQPGMWQQRPYQGNYNNTNRYNNYNNNRWPRQQQQQQGQQQLQQIGQQGQQQPSQQEDLPLKMNQDGQQQDGVIQQPQ